MSKGGHQKQQNLQRNTSGDWPGKGKGPGSPITLPQHPLVHLVDPGQECSWLWLALGEEGLPLQQDFKGRCQLSAVRECPLPRQEVSHRILPGSLEGGQTRQIVRLKTQLQIWLGSIWSAAWAPWLTEAESGGTITLTRGLHSHLWVYLPFVGSQAVQLSSPSSVTSRRKQYVCYRCSRTQARLHKKHRATCQNLNSQVPRGKTASYTFP